MSTRAQPPDFINEVNNMILRGLTQRTSVVRHTPAIIIRFNEASNHWEELRVITNPSSAGSTVQLSDREILLFLDANIARRSLKSFSPPNLGTFKRR
jgi:hypothetical protein